MYIPLYGKAYVSRKGIILSDKRAEEIWAKECFPLKGKSRSKWLAYYIGMRSAVIDSLVKEAMSLMSSAAIVHIGCGMDSRIERVDRADHAWYDIDFPAVISERRRYFGECDGYRMIEADVTEAGWLDKIPSGESAVVVMEGVSMYMSPEALKKVLTDICAHFGRVQVIMDCYTELAAKLSKYKNPINDVGVTQVYGIDDPRVLEDDALKFKAEHRITPDSLIDELCGMEKRIFKRLYAGGIAEKMYRLYEYEKTVK